MKSALRHTVIPRRAYRGFRSWRFSAAQLSAAQRSSSRRGKAGQVDSRVSSLEISLRDSVGLERLSKTRTATPPRNGGDDDRNGAERSGLFSGGRQAEVEGDLPCLP